MKKILILLGAVGVAMLVFIYTTSTAQKSQKYIYCQMVCHNEECNVYQGTGNFLSEEEIKKVGEKKYELDALNYLVLQGWEAYQALRISTTITGSGYNLWYLRKPASKEELEAVVKAIETKPKKEE